MTRAEAAAHNLNLWCPSCGAAGYSAAAKARAEAGEPCFTCPGTMDYVQPERSLEQVMRETRV